MLYKLLNTSEIASWKSESVSKSSFDTESTFDWILGSILRRWTIVFNWGVMRVTLQLTGVVSSLNSPESAIRGVTGRAEGLGNLLKQ